MNQLYNQKFVDKVEYLAFVVTTLVVSVMGIQRKNTNMVQNIVFFSLLIMTLSKLKDRDYYLPFLGDAVFPHGLLQEMTPAVYDMEVEIHVPKQTKVVYWASLENESGNNDQMPWIAYGNYSNSGVTMSDSDGHALLRLKSPRGYKTPWGKNLKPHVHYRYFLTNGMMSRVFTHFI